MKRTFYKESEFGFKKKSPKVLAAAHTPEPPPACKLAGLKLIPLNQKQGIVRKLELRGNRFVKGHITMCCTRLQQPFFLAGLGACLKISVV